MKFSYLISRLYFLKVGGGFYLLFRNFIVSINKDIFVNQRSDKDFLKSSID